jgi:hypothetical protein
MKQLITTNKENLIILIKIIPLKKAKSIKIQRKPKINIIIQIHKMVKIYLIFIRKLKFQCISLRGQLK